MHNRRKTEKLTDEQVAKMAELSRDGVHQVLIAERFGLSRTYVGRLIREATRQKRDVNKCA